MKIFKFLNILINIYFSKKIQNWNQNTFLLNKLKKIQYRIRQTAHFLKKFDKYLKKIFYLIGIKIQQI
ncbi:hypothetical protein TTHERM_000522499 (macronuclear) [Tetrahymena thermophila SB210]|uniref:Uncharacterized protein n=1 Tax=Tetrahymena thermophila (strain SB210) TaxID=312017 RepID=W7XII6_TETTS|nr:hypothetical protein TTHERM_000522499 [Tetrahymena thermophila SB210]EWS74686.1 hypothetical protein TTHERM_000522499 [Tetrahymena thermophila SB210]|eukprot:XP_012652776.1 hypothetical protein TTHERM_000522499 [Tetrahymena thermophila SB210]